ncbi:MAG: type III-A CRISPR-associated RAMP protein Csm4 [Lachnospiraceae bacterium]|nr:type III-A CRISPR-associated RAMP protein Csm4 [Lachnospiraceae bacterium]
MYYKLLKLKFTKGVHFGNGSLEGAETAFNADTFFSAMCIEALSVNKEGAELLVSMVRENKLLLSDAFPYKDSILYIPKPIMHIERKGNSGLSERKLIKKIRYVPLDDFDDYVAGCANLSSDEYAFEFGKYSVNTRAFVYSEETQPYRVVSFSFYDSCGLYIVAGFGDEAVEEYIDELVEGLSYSGIGGKRSSGYGRFEYYKSKIPDKMLQRMEGEHSKYMSLSVSLPKNEELGKSIENAEYLMIRRGGFVASESYAKEFVKKRDIYAFKAGSCFGKRFEGDVFDVSVSGAHPVYRYLKPMFIGVNK